MIGGGNNDDEQKCNYDVTVMVLSDLHILIHAIPMPNLQGTIIISILQMRN